MEEEEEMGACLPSTLLHTERLSWEGWVSAGI